MNKVSITMYSSDLRIENEECLKKVPVKEEHEEGIVLMLSAYSLHSI